MHVGCGYAATGIVMKNLGFCSRVLDLIGNLSFKRAREGFALLNGAPRVLPCLGNVRLVMAENSGNQGGIAYKRTCLDFWVPLQWGFGHILVSFSQHILIVGFISLL